MKNKANFSTLFLALVGSIYLFVSIIGGIITNASETFWAGFGFLSFATIIAVLILLLFGNSKTTIKDVFFNIPIYYIGTVYFVLSGIISVLHMLLGILSFKWLLIIQLVVFVIFVAYFIFAYINKSNAENVISKAKEKNNFIRDASTKITTAANLCDDRDFKIKLEKLSEDFQYSKPAASDDLTEIENKILQALAVLDYQVENNDFTKANETIDSVNKLLVIRNALAKNTH